MAANTYVLIDYENVQPANLALVAEKNFCVKIFIGSSQTRIPIDLVTALHALGSKAEYIRIAGSGPNALDFHISYYMGRISALEPDATFHIVSKDTGFDPLLTHLKSKGIQAKREATVGTVPVLKNLTVSSSNAQVDAVIAKLKGMPKSRPQKEKSLKTMISAWFGKKLSADGIDQIVQELVSRNVVAVEGTSVKYSLPK